MIYNELVNKIIEESKKNNFKTRTGNMQLYVDSLTRDELIDVVKNIGIIPERINPSSTEEKLYSKTSDIILSRCFNEIGLKSEVLIGRGNSADVWAESQHGYNLVADAKAFRISRTAKNQKDFKVDRLSEWRGTEYDYAILVAPYFEYPKNESQIYSQALEQNVCIFSWEHILFLLESNKVENDVFSMESIWNTSKKLSRDSLSIGKTKYKSLFPEVNERFSKKVGCTVDELKQKFIQYANVRIEKGEDALKFYYEEHYKAIKLLSREELEKKLLEKICSNDKISEINKKIDYIKKLTKEE